MKKMPGPIGLLLMGATFICFCVMFGASASGVSSSLPDLQSELQQSSFANFGHPGQIQEMQNRLRELMPRTLPTKERIHLQGSSSRGSVSGLKAVNCVRQRDIVYDEAQDGDPALQGQANSLAVSITGQDEARSDSIGWDGSGDGIEKMVDSAFNNRIKSKEKDSKIARSTALGNNMDIDVSGISVSAINTVEGGSAIATSNIIINPVQMVISPSQVEEKLK